MLDQNTDRMWYVIGAVLIGAAIIFGMNTLMPETFASVEDSFQSTISHTERVIKYRGRNLVLDPHTVRKGSHTHEGDLTRARFAMDRDMVDGLLGQKVEVSVEIRSDIPIEPYMYIIGSDAQARYTDNKRLGVVGEDWGRHTFEFTLYDKPSRESNYDEVWLTVGTSRSDGAIVESKNASVRWIY